MYDNLPPLKEVITTHGLAAKKSLGQNFILDPNILAKIVRGAFPVSADAGQGTVIEVGPGPGGLTRALLSGGVKNLIAIEKDDRCLNALEEIKQYYPENLTIISGDALKVDFRELGTYPRRIVANLPYNISTVLLINWLKHIKDFSSLTLMFQKEVAERITAVPGTSAYGRLSVLAQWLCKTEIKMILPPEVFTPAPKISSALVYLETREEPLAPASFPWLEKVVATAFNQRRKMLRSSLKPLGNPEELCKIAGISSELRAENVSVSAFCAIADYLEKR